MLVAVVASMLVVGCAAPHHNARTAGTPGTQAGEGATASACLKAYGGRFQNTATDGQFMRNGAHSWPLVIARQLRDETAYVWEQQPGHQRVYLLWPGRHRHDRTAAMSKRIAALVDVDTRYPGQAHPFTAMFSAGTLAQNRRADAICLRR